MPSPASVQFSTIVGSDTARTLVTATWGAWNRQYTPTLSSGTGGGTALISTSTIGGTTGLTWTQWNETYVGTSGGTSSGTTSTITIDSPSIVTWGRWNEDYTASATITGATGSATTQSWIMWNAAYHRLSSITNSGVTPRNLHLSDEEYQAQARQMEERTRQAREQARVSRLEWDQAKERAALVLRENLSDAQKEELAANRYFTLRRIREDGSQRIYRIHQGRSHNVEEVDDAGKRLRRYCMHPSIGCPDEDTMLTQKLWLEDPELEQEFLRSANIS